MSFNQRWNALDSPDILCKVISKLRGEKMERRNRRCQVREPILDDLVDFIEEDTILIKDPLFSHEVLADYHTKLERLVRQKQMKNYTIKAEDEKDKKYMKGSSEDSRFSSSGCKMCNRWHDLDVCKAFNSMTVEKRNKYLSKQILCYACYEAISPKHTARKFTRRKSCVICLVKHPTGFHGYKIRRKDDSKTDNDPGKTIKNNCVNMKDVQCESAGTGGVLSKCVVPVKVQNENSDKEIMTFAMLDTFSQGTFTTTNLMEQLNISGIETSINVKTLIGHQKESSGMVEDRSVSKKTISDRHPK